MDRYSFTVVDSHHRLLAGLPAHPNKRMPPNRRAKCRQTRYPDPSPQPSTKPGQVHGETGYVEGQNATVEYHWLDGQFDHLPALMADLIRRRVAVIASTAEAGALAAKKATTTIPIVFRVGEDPVKLGLVSNLARPGGNATGVNFFEVESLAKRLALLHEFVPDAVHVAVLVDPANIQRRSPGSAGVAVAV